MWQRALSGSGGGGGYFEPYKFTPSGTETINVGFAPKQVVLYVSVSGGATGLKVLWYDVANNTVKLSVDGSFESAESGYISVSGTTITYTPPASSWYKETRLFAY